jgi:hypothetical protein
MVTTSPGPAYGRLSAYTVGTLQESLMLRVLAAARLASHLNSLSGTSLKRGETLLQKSRRATGREIKSAAPTGAATGAKRS